MIERRLENGDSGGVGKLPGEERLARWSTNRGVAIVSGEASALGCETIEVGGFGEAVAVGAQDIAGMVVG